MSKNNLETQSQKIPWLQIIPIILSLFTFLLGGGYFYNNFINRPVLTYTLLENYDLGSQFFSGIVIENRGKQNLTDINLTISDLEAEISALNFPGLHESISMTSGGISNNSVTIEMPRLSSGKTVSMYLLSEKPIGIKESNILLSSSQVVGQESGEIFSIISFSSQVAAFISIFSAVFAIWSSISLWRIVSKRKDAEIEAMQKILKVIQDSDALNESTSNLEARSKKIDEGTSDLEARSKKVVESINYIQNRLKEAKNSVDSLSDMLQEAIKTGKIESNDQVENIFNILKNYQKGLLDISQTTDKMTEISKQLVQKSHTRRFR